MQIGIYLQKKTYITDIVLATSKKKRVGKKKAFQVT